MRATSWGYFFFNSGILSLQLSASILSYYHYFCCLCRNNLIVHPTPWQYNTNLELEASYLILIFIYMYTIHWNNPLIYICILSYLACTKLIAITGGKRPIHLMHIYRICSCLSFLTPSQLNYILSFEPRIIKW